MSFFCVVFLLFRGVPCQAATTVHQPGASGAFGAPSFHNTHVAHAWHPIYLPFREEEDTLLVICIYIYIYVWRWPLKFVLWIWPVLYRWAVGTWGPDPGLYRWILSCFWSWINTEHPEESHTGAHPGTELRSFLLWGDRDNHHATVPPFRSLQHHLTVWTSTTVHKPPPAMQCCTQVDKNMIFES